MKFAGIHHQFRFAPQAFHCLIHLLAANNGNIPIDFAPHKQRWRSDLVDFGEERKLVPHGTVRPGLAEFGVIVKNVLIVSIEACKKRRAGSRDRRLKARALRDDEIRRNGSLRPSADTQFIGIGNALLDCVVDHRHVVLEVFISPIRIDSFAECLAVPR